MMIFFLIFEILSRMHENKIFFDRILIPDLYLCSIKIQTGSMLLDDDSVFSMFLLLPAFVSCFSFSSSVSNGGCVVVDGGAGGCRRWFFSAVAGSVCCCSSCLCRGAGFFFFFTGVAVGEGRC